MATHLFYSDLHIRPDRIREVDECLGTIGEVAVKHVVPTGGYVINGGDLFNDRGLIRSSCFDTLVRHRHEWRRLGVKHIDNVGNHDQEDRAGLYHPLRVFHDPDRGWHVADIGALKVDGLLVIPYSHRLDKELEHHAKGRKKWKAVIVHAGIAGAWKNDKSRDFDGIKAEAFAGFPRVFSGHYHYRHAVQGFEHIQYIGSPMQHTHAERGQEKGVLLWDDATDEVRFVEIPGTPRHFEMSIEWTGKEWEQSPCEDVQAGDRIAVRIVGPSDRVKLVTREWIEKRIGDGFEIKIERQIKDETVSRLALKPEESADIKVLARKYVDYREPALDTKRLMAVGVELLA